MKKICFIPPLQDKTVNKIKTQTRRLIVSRTGYFNVTSKDGVVTGIWQCDANGWNGENLIPVKSRYNVGEIIAIAQPYKDILETLPEPYRRESDGWISTEVLETIGYSNKMYVKPSLMPYRIRINEVRAEKLQSISNEDCIKEGIFKHISHAKVYWKNGFDGLMYEAPRCAYAALINKINGKDTWERNPYMWVYDYELV